MAKTGPIVLIEDDEDDAELFKTVLLELEIGNNLLWFSDTQTAMDYLTNSSGQPFLIVCDVNLPKQNGIAFKHEIEANEHLRRKSIPFIFYSTAVDKYVVTKAYEDLTIQGFFKKEHNYSIIKEQIKSIITYWMHCEHPSDIG
ncbi:response regulator [Sphingobacteriaceae bacterium]|nr:response regulator [Sphingobacteriaceae bacterium]